MHSICQCLSFFNYRICLCWVLVKFSLLTRKSFPAGS